MPLKIILTLFALMCSAAFGAEDAEYVRVTRQRAEKIVSALDLQDSQQRERVIALVARQYRDLQALHEQRDAARAKGESSAAQLTQAETAVQIAALHYAFLGRLAGELSPDQIEQVKDGLTYGVRGKTYQVYQDMVPGLSAEQKRQILAWLTEAREHAMDAGSSEEKHQWFGKYKGRINNYLAAAGIDLKQAERDLAARKRGGAKSRP